MYENEIKALRLLAPQDMRAEAKQNIIDLLRAAEPRDADPEPDWCNSCQNWHDGSRSNHTIVRSPENRRELAAARLEGYAAGRAEIEAKYRADIDVWRRMVAEERAALEVASAQIVELEAEVRRRIDWADRDNAAETKLAAANTRIAELESEVCRADYVTRRASRSVK